MLEVIQTCGRKRKLEKRHLKAAVDPSPKPGFSDLKIVWNSRPRYYITHTLHTTLMSSSSDEGWQARLECNCYNAHGRCYILENDCLVGICAHQTPLLCSFVKPDPLGDIE